MESGCSAAQRPSSREVVGGRACGQDLGDVLYVQWTIAARSAGGCRRSRSSHARTRRAAADPSTLFRGATSVQVPAAPWASASTGPCIQHRQTSQETDGALGRSVLAAQLCMLWHTAPVPAYPLTASDTRFSGNTGSEGQSAVRACMKYTHTYTAREPVNAHSFCR